jgi:Holliday junction resolvasome RuvABC endonuclease subunit
MDGSPGKDPAGCPVTLLALDLGRKTGWACGSTPNDFDSGTRVLATPAEVSEWHKTRVDRTRDPRIFRLWSFIRSFSPDVVVFEDVEFSTYTGQTQMWAALRSAVWLSDVANGFPIKITECVPVSTLKKFACGHGGATKGMMEARLRRQFPAFQKRKMDDNEVDAVWIYQWAWTILGRRLDKVR